MIREAAYERLMEKGWIGGDGRRIWETFRRPYRWLIEQMKERLGPSTTNSDYPVWCWHRHEVKRPKPDLRSSGHFMSGTKAYRLELLVEKTKILLSDFEAWHFVLMNAYCPTRLDVEYTEEEREWEQEVESLGLHPHHDSLPEHLEKQKRDSWQRIFNIQPTSIVQGTLWKIEASQIVDVTPFTSR